jgi:hypothetical protein
MQKEDEKFFCGRENLFFAAKDLKLKPEEKKFCRSRKIFRRNSAG